MGVFKKLFSGGDKPEDKANSEYLNNAYDSLGSGADLDPDRILGGGAESRAEDLPETQETTAISDVTEPVYEADEADEITAAYNGLGGDTGEMDLDEIRETADRALEYISDMSELDYDEGFTADIEDDDITDDLGVLSEAEDNDNEPAANYYDDQKAEPVDAEYGYDDMHNGSEEESADDTVSADSLIPAAGTVKGGSSEEVIYPEEEVYAAYAPKNMRPQVTRREYYDLDDIDDETIDEGESDGFKAVLRKHAKLIIGSAAAAVVVVGIIVACVFIFNGGVDPLMGYTSMPAAKGNVIKTMAAGGNVEPNARYEITSLVSGAVTESPLNAGEEVKAGELVYKIDDTNAQIAVQMAERDVERARDESSGSSSSSSDLKIYANASGTITDLRISVGSKVTGGQIATITQANGTETGIIPNVTGTVQSMNVREGSTVSSGQVIATLKGTDTDSPKLDLEGSKLALEQAQKELDKYKIASPIDGVILVKNAKVGDNVSVGKSDQPLMVIADMSKMKFSIEVDELDIWNIQLGQTVVITANALPGETFSGEITNIAGEGEKKGDGVTTYAVEITISDPGKIKSGMNVDAKIIIDSAINVVTLPERALYESDGQNALVITNASGVPEEDIANPADYPNITVPNGYNLVKVRYGVSDGTNVEITDGLKVGDIVLYMPDSESSLSTAPNLQTQSASNDNEGSSETGNEKGGDSSSDYEKFGDTDRERSENLQSTGKSALQDDLDI